MSAVDQEPLSQGSPLTAVSPPGPRGFRRFMLFVVLAGVILPAGAIFGELTFRLCSFLFDPIPTNWHLALLLAVPLSSLATLWVCRACAVRWVTPTAFLVGVSMGVGAFYSVLFLPLAPFCVFAIIAYGLGLLGLSPFLALIASVNCSRRLGTLDPGANRSRVRALRLGTAFALLVLGGFMLANYVTTTGLRMAVSGDEATSERGVRLIRRFGSDSALLRACYELPAGFWPDEILAGFRNDTRITRDEARSIYYRVTGDSFNSVPPPKLVGRRSRFVEDFEFDSDVGGTAVNSLVRSLSLASSRLDSRVEPDALVAYTEWTMVFANSSRSQREARAEIALPPGGVVSRLTLWVNGEEREAAFSTRGKVRQAYQQVAVVQRRDPVLVTTCGPDRILMQCFPVPPDGGTMKVRIGITSPLTPQGSSRAALSLPHFVEKNFAIPGGVTHSLLLESGGAADAKTPSALTDSELSAAGCSFSYRRGAGVRSVWTPDTLDPKRCAIVQTISEARPTPPPDLVVVVDGSRRVADSRRDIADALSGLPRECRFSVIAASETVTRLTPMRRATPDAVRKAQRKILDMPFIGGVDNRLALLAAQEAASREDCGAILWIHGPQPLTSVAQAERLVQVCESRPGAMKVVAVAAADGRNSILAELERTGAVVTVPRRGALASDLRSLFAGWRTGSRSLMAVKRERVPLAKAVGVRASSHVARLWARDEVMRICRSGDSRKLPEASQLAAQYQIVTPVSGAVVLETEEQYRKAGLKSVDPSGVPSTVPEPAGWLTLAAGLGMVATAWRRRRSCG